MRERDLSPPVQAWLEGRGYTVYAEVPCMFRVIDLVGVRGRDICCVELKRALSRAVIRQADLNSLITQCTYCAVATNPRSLDAIRKSNAGLLRVADGVVTELLPPPCRHSTAEHYRTQIIDRVSHLEPGGIGGIAQEAGNGPAQEVARKIVVYRQDHPHATWKELYEAIPNHYADFRSMYGAMRIRACTRRILAGEVVLEAGATHAEQP